MSTFDVEVISDPIGLLPNKGFKYDSPVYRTSPDYGTQIIKPALLFADKVRLVSSRTSVHHFSGVRAAYVARNPWAQFTLFLRMSASRHQAELERLRFSEDDLAPSAEAGAILKTLSSCQTQEALDDAFMRIAKPMWDKYENQVASLVEAHLLVWQERHDALIAPEIRQAIDRGVVSLQGWANRVDPEVQTFVPSDDFLKESLDGMLERLRDPSRVALLDPTISKLSPRQRRTSQGPPPTFFANTLLSRMVGLQDLPIIEILDLREDLKTHLPHFRSEMIRLSEEVASIESSDEVADLVERRWHRDILPSLEEIRREVAAARYPRRLLDAVTSDPAAMAAGAGALTLAAGGLAYNLSALLPAVAGAALPLLKARADRNQRLDQAKNNRLFFLYAVQERFSAR
ncbi:hypothetical protein [Micromonospora narathiwatensis]|uniref:hypothetical protein n=1 Tax=Micromonospora narathiwatensis TaxID=299146 RepID=UPI0012FE6681|nr:hypothetical protein [Micromonospora narathiwatensis]